MGSEKPLMVFERPRLESEKLQIGSERPLVRSERPLMGSERPMMRCKEPREGRWRHNQEIPHMCSIGHCLLWGCCLGVSVTPLHCNGIESEQGSGSEGDAVLYNTWLFHNVNTFFEKISRGGA